MKPRTWYSLKAADDGESYELLIYDDIGKNWWGEGIGAQELIDELKDVPASSTIDVRINSAGGLVFEGLAIYNALVRHAARVVTHVDGLAASIASIVALAGDEVRIAENAYLMVHCAWGVVIGNASDMRDLAELLDKLDLGLAETYAQKSGESAETALEWMAAETWFNATEAEDLGLVDVVEGKREEKAVFDLADYRHVPTQVAARFGGPPKKAQAAEPIVIDWEAAIAALHADREAPPPPPPPPPAAERSDEIDLLRLRGSTMRKLELTA